MSVLNRVYIYALACFFLSGSTGLIYEVLWTRRLTLVFGHSVLAVSTVVTAFMGGLAAGSYFGGRLADRGYRQGEDAEHAPLSALSFGLYGKLEIFIGIWALVTMPLLDGVESVYVRLSQALGVGTPLYLLCFVLASLALVPPTSAMGATVPVLSRLFVLHRSQLGSRLSWLYGTNTFGAVLGAGLAGYFLLPQLGLRTSLVLGGLINVSIGLVAITVSRRSFSLDPVQDEKSDPVAGEEPESPGESKSRLYLLAFFASTGLASLIYQVGWTRALILSLGSSVYAFSTILLIFLAGIALGSLAYGPLSQKRQPGFVWLAWIQLVVGFFGITSILALGRLPLVLKQLYPYSGGTFVGFLCLGGGLATLILIPPTFCMGLTFPLVTQLYARQIRSLGQEVGSLYAANTVGCIVGSFLSGFFMLPAWGVQITLQTAACLSFVACLLALLGERRHSGQRRRLVTAAALLPLVGVWFLPTWEQALMGSGLGYQSLYQSRTLQDLRHTVVRPPAYYKDGLSCTVSLCLDGADNVALLVNGKIDASCGRLDMMNMKTTAFLPLLCHDKPRKVALIGLGGGFTLQALTRDERVEHIDCIELEQAVVEAARYFRGFNGDILAEPRLKMHVTDGRTYILGAQSLYDIIISQPSNPWIAGIGNLFTTDFYRVCRQRLEKDGVFCQWCNTYAVSGDDLKMVMRGFFSVFPYGEVWQPSHGDLVLLGSSTPLSFRPQQLARMWQSQSGFRSDLAGIDLDKPEQLLGHYLCSREVALKEAGEGPLNTDDHPLLEFSAPHSLYRKQQYGENLAMIAGLRARGGLLPTPQLMPSQGPVALCQAWFNLGDGKALAAVLPGCPESAEKAYLDAVSQKSPERVREQVDRALQSYPEDLRLRFLAARNAIERNDLPGALEHFARAEVLLQKLPATETALAYPLWSQKGAVLQQARRWEEALQAYRQAVRFSDLAAPWREMGRCQLRLGQHQDATESLRQALQRNPYDFVARGLLGQVNFAQGDLTAATDNFRQALRLVPDDYDSLLNLAITSAKAGRVGEARELNQTLLSYYPDDPEGLRWRQNFAALR